MKRPPRHAAASCYAARSRRPQLGAFTLTVLLVACGQSPDLPATTDTPPPGTHSPTPQPAPVPAPSALRWSDEATWQALGQPVPAQGSTVTIPTGQTVLLDTDTPALAGVHVNGQLHLSETFTDTNANGALDVRAGFVMVHGELRAGSETDPYAAKATFTLTGTEDVDVTGMNMGAKVLGVMGGKLELHGTPLTPWVRLNATAEPGATTLTLDRPVNWRPGDRIMITMTGGMHGVVRHWQWRYGDWEKLHENEVVTVRAVSGNTITLDTPLRFQHYGQVQTIEGFTVDQRAEVALLSRDIKIQGDETSAQSQFGGHVMVMNDGQARVSNVEFEHMGQKGILGRYPLHWHRNGNSDGQYLKGSSIHGAFNRFVSLHATDNVLLEDNVGYHTIGHGYFLEDGAERGNTFRRNLGALIRPAREDEALLPSDDRPAAFWFSNPDNTVVDNVAVGSMGSGFWYGLATRPTGLSADRTDILPHRTPLRKFQGNRSHSNGEFGLLVSTSPDADRPHLGHHPVIDPLDPQSAPQVALYEDFESGNDGSAAWFGGEHLQLVRPVIADQTYESGFQASSTVIRDGAFIGKSANSRRMDDNGVMPRMLGTMTYSGRVALRDMTFINYPAAEGAAGLLLEDHLRPLQNLDYLSGLRFVNANPVWMHEVPQPGANATVYQLPPAALNLPGTERLSLVDHVPFVLTANCQLKPEWNAHVCADRYFDFQFIPDGVGVHPGNTPVPFTIRRNDGEQDQLLFARAALVANRAYTVTAPADPPRSYELMVGNFQQPEDYVHLVLPLAQAPSKVWRDFSEQIHLTPASSVEEVLADTYGNRFHYDPARFEIHLKVRQRATGGTDTRIFIR